MSVIIIFVHCVCVEVFLKRVVLVKKTHHLIPSLPISPSSFSFSLSFPSLRLSLSSSISISAFFFTMLTYKRWLLIRKTLDTHYSAPYHLLKCCEIGDFLMAKILLGEKAGRRRGQKKGERTGKREEMRRVERERKEKI